MSDPRSEPTAPALQKSSKTLWIILGSLVFLAVISMGGCVACIALIGLSSLDGDGPGGWAGEGRAGSARGAAADGLPGTWGGTLNCDDGDTLNATIKVSDAGNPLYLYETSRGHREAEITSVGQTFRFVPPGGGVFTAVVDSLSVTPDGFSYSTRTSSERAGGGTLTQGGGRMTYRAALAGDELEVEITSGSSSTVSQPGIVIPGNESSTDCRGRLRKD
jgi:hypothetical protein